MSNIVSLFSKLVINYFTKFNTYFSDCKIYQTQKNICIYVYVCKEKR